MLYNYCKIKNIDSEDHSILGTMLAPTEEYIIEDSKRTSIASDSIILTKISNGLLQVGSDIEYISDISEQINWLKNINNIPKDFDGSPIQRQKAAKSGWTYLAHSIEFETSQLGSLYSKDNANTDIPNLTIKFYDVSNNELTTQGSIDTDCVKTVITFSPTFDYEIIGGTVRQRTSPSSDVRIWVMGGILELGAAGTKEMVGGLNLYYLADSEAVQTDGRASKYMAKVVSGIPYNANQLQTIVRHDAGFKHKINLNLEYFRA